MMRDALKLFLFTHPSALIPSCPAHFTLTVTSCLPQGEEKVTVKVPDLPLTEVTVKRSRSPSESACGSARMMMSAQFGVEGLTRGAPLRAEFSSLTATVAEPPLLLIST